MFTMFGQIYIYIWAHSRVKFKIRIMSIHIVGTQTARCSQKLTRKALRPLIEMWRKGVDRKFIASKLKELINV